MTPEEVASLPANASAAGQMAFVIGEISQWLEVHRPGVSPGTSSWRPALAGFASEWAHLADWTLELSTQLSVEFLSASQSAQQGQGAALDALTQDLDQFENDYLAPPSMASRLVGRTGEVRQRQANERARKMEAAWREAREAKEKQLNGLVACSQLAGLLVDAADLLLAFAPQVVASVQQPPPLMLVDPANIFEQRTHRRRVESAALASGALRQVLPRLESESRQHRATSQRLANLRSLDEERLHELRARLASSIAKANHFLLPTPKPAPSASGDGYGSIVPRRTAWSVGALMRDARMPHVSGSVGKALVRLRDSEQTNAEFAADLGKVVEASGLHRTWIPVGGSTTHFSYALGFLASEMVGERAQLWTPQMRRGLADNIGRWADGLDYYLPVGDVFELPHEARGLRTDKLFQVIYELSEEQPLAAMRLFSKSTELPMDGKVQLTRGNRDEVDGLTWMAGWLRQVEPQEKDEFHWSQAMGRLCLAQMEDSYHRAPVFKDKQAVQDFCGRNKKTPDVALCAGVLRDALRDTGEGNSRLIVATVWWSHVFLGNPSHDELKLLEKVCEASAKSQGKTDKLLAEWLGDPKRFSAGVDLKPFPTLYAFTEAGKYLHDRSANIPVALLVQLAKRAPGLLKTLPDRRTVVLASGATCSGLGDAPVWMDALPVFRSRQEAYGALTDRLSFLGLRPGDPARLQWWKMAMEKRDIALASALHECIQPPADSALNVHAAVEEAWHEEKLRPGNWAEWLKSSRQRHLVSLYPTRPQDRVEFLATCLMDDFRSSAINTSGQDTLQLKRWFLDPRMQPARKEDAPAALFELVSRALDAGLAGPRDQIIHNVIPGEGVAALAQMERILASVLQQMDCSSWSQPPKVLAASWRATYEQRWERRLHEDMGNAFAEPAPKEGDFFIQQKEGSAFDSGKEGATCWFYDTHAIATDALALEIDHVKFQQLVDPREHMVPGLHVRFSVAQDGVRQVVGLDRSIQVGGCDSTQSVLDQWEAMRGEIASSCKKDKADICIEGLRVDCLPMSRVSFHPDSLDAAGNTYTIDSLPGPLYGSVASPMGRNPAIPMTVYGQLQLARPTPWTCARTLPVLAVKSWGRVPLDMCAMAFDKMPLGREHTFATAHGGLFAPRDYGTIAFDSLMQSLVDDVDSQPPAQTQSSRRRRWNILPGSSRLGPP